MVALFANTMAYKLIFRYDSMLLATFSMKLLPNQLFSLYISAAEYSYLGVNTWDFFLLESIIFFLERAPVPKTVSLPSVVHKESAQ